MKVLKQNSDRVLKENSEHVQVRLKNSGHYRQLRQGFVAATCELVPRMQKTGLLPLAWAISPLLSSGCTPHGASIIAFGLGYLILVIVWLYAEWRERSYLWPG